MLRTTPLIALLLISCSGGKDDADIRLCYSRYQDAIVRQDGVAILEVLDAESRAHYDTLLSRAKELGRAELEALPVAERLNVLLTRVRVSAADLANMTGEELLKKSISDGWTPTASLGGLKLARITIDGDAAKAKISHEPQMLRFKKENGEWRLSQVYTLEVFNHRLENSLRGQGMKQNEAIMQALKMENDGKDVVDSIWDGPL